MSPSKLKERKERAREMSRVLKYLYPASSSDYTVLTYSNPWELTVAVILSARNTDKKVNEVTQNLFKKYPDLQDYTNTTPEEFSKDINQIGFFNAKAKNIVAAAKIVQNS